jgi:hypothetical protein
MSRIKLSLGSTWPSRIKLNRRHKRRYNNSLSRVVHKLKARVSDRLDERSGFLHGLRTDLAVRKVFLIDP